MMASTKLTEEIQRRFSYILDPDQPNFEPIYAVATALDPRFRLVLNDGQINAARRRIMQIVSCNLYYFQTKL